MSPTSISSGEPLSVGGNEIGDLLVDIGIITPEELATALDEQVRSGDRLTLILDRMGLVSYHQLKDSLELQFGVNFIALSKNIPSREIADLVSEEVKRKFKLIPVANNGTQFTVAMVNPDDLIALDTLRVQLRSGHLKKLVCTADEFEHCMQVLYEGLVIDDQTLTPAAPASLPVAGQNGDATISAEVPALAVVETAAAEIIEVKAAEPPKALTKVPAKKHLQSLFGDDDDDDDFDTVTKVEAPAAEVVEPAAATIAPEPTLPPEPISVAEPIAVAEPPTAVEEPKVVPLASDSKMAQAEIVMEAALANVTSHLIESSQSALNASANRKLLEDVVESELGGSEEETDIHRMKEAQNASVMLLAHEIIGKATQKRCSDIHLEPEGSGVALRYFLHGELLADCMLPLEIHAALVSSYKVIAGLDPQSIDKPQDKKFITRVEEDEVELRITTIPTDNGEMVAISMRFTDPNSAGALAQAKLVNSSEN